MVEKYFLDAFSETKTFLQIPFNYKFISGLQYLFALVQNFNQQLRKSWTEETSHVSLLIFYPSKFTYTFANQCGKNGRGEAGWTRRA